MDLSLGVGPDSRLRKWTESTPRAIEVQAIFILCLPGFATCRANKPDDYYEGVHEKIYKAYNTAFDDYVSGKWVSGIPNGWCPVFRYNYTNQNFTRCTRFNSNDPGSLFRAGGIS